MNAEPKPGGVLRGPSCNGMLEVAFVRVEHDSFWPEELATVKAREVSS